MMNIPLVVVSTCLISAIGILAAEPQNDTAKAKSLKSLELQSVQPLAEVVKKQPKLEEFIGTWKGKWDGYFGVQFTISAIQDDKEKLNLIYEWEEKKGQPYQRSESKVKMEGNVLKAGAIELSLMQASPNQAIATGKFAKPRAAILTKEK